MTTSPSPCTVYTTIQARFIPVVPACYPLYTGFSQQHLVESLKTSLGTAKDSTQYADRLNRSARCPHPASGLCYRYAAAAQELSERIRYHKGLCRCLHEPRGFILLFRTMAGWRTVLPLRVCNGTGTRRFRRSVRPFTVSADTIITSGRTGLAIPYMNDAMAIGSRLWRIPPGA